MTKKYDCILSFGDSHVAGFELFSESALADYLQGKITLEQVDSYGKPLAFPKILGDRLGIPCYNFALSGGSNARSIRLLINSLGQYSNPLILFGYTNIDRFEFYYPDKGVFLGRDDDNFIQVGMQWDHGVQYILPGRWKMTHPINDIFIRDFLRPRDSLFEVAVVVQSICKAHDLDVLHLPLFPFEKYPSYFFNFEEKKNYAEWCNSKGFTRTRLEHWNIDAHRALAELLFKEIPK
jgi:hypothetical protein